MRTTFILGAGFSAAEGFPLCRELKEDVLAFIKNERHPNHEASLTPGRGFEDGEAYEGLRHVDPSGSLGLEEVLIELRKALEHARPDDPRHRTAIVLKTACARLLWKRQLSIRKVSSCYQAFTERFLKPVEGRNNAVISFNWDILLERSLTDSGVQWQYHFLPGFVPVLKPHGSINWSSYLETGGHCTYPGWTRIAPNSTVSYDKWRPLLDPDPQEINPDLRFMRYPGDPEFPEQNRNVSLIWSAAERVLKECEAIVFIGYSLPEYDSYSTEVFGRIVYSKNVSVYNPSPTHLQRFRTVFGDKVHLFEQAFEESPYGRRR
ncbi:MAG TPA: hypothetical protein VMF56_06960 [Acidobacteriaceae bacterium]|nr:hypothetical protein [Acidobacteriaceae bacterium]